MVGRYNFPGSAPHVSLLIVYKYSELVYNYLFFFKDLPFRKGDKLEILSQSKVSMLLVMVMVLLW